MAERKGADPVPSVRGAQDAPTQDEFLTRAHDIAEWYAFHFLNLRNHACDLCLEKAMNILRETDRNAREDCARIADKFQEHKILGIVPGPDATIDGIAQHFFRFGAERAATAIRQSIRS